MKSASANSAATRVLLSTGSSRSVDVQFGHNRVSKENWEIGVWGSSFSISGVTVNLKLGVHAVSAVVVAESSPDKRGIIGMWLLAVRNRVVSAQRARNIRRQETSNLQGGTLKAFWTNHLCGGKSGASGNPNEPHEPG